MKKSFLSVILLLIAAGAVLGMTGCSSEQGGADETTAVTTASTAADDAVKTGYYRYAYEYCRSSRILDNESAKRVSVWTELEIPSEWMPTSLGGGVIAKAPDPETGLLKSYINIGSYDLLYETDSDFTLDETTYSQIHPEAFRDGLLWNGAETIVGDNYVIYRCPQELSEHDYDVPLAALAFVRISPRYIAKFRMCGELSELDELVGIIASVSRKDGSDYDHEAVNAAVKTMEEVSYNAEFVATVAYADFSYEFERELDTPIAFVGELTTRYFPTNFSNEYSTDIRLRPKIEEPSVTLWEVEPDYTFDERLSESPMVYYYSEDTPEGPYVVLTSGVNSFGNEYVVYRLRDGTGQYFMFIRLAENYIARVVGAIDEAEMQRFVDTVHLK